MATTRKQGAKVVRLPGSGHVVEAREPAPAWATPPRVFGSVFDAIAGNPQEAASMKARAQLALQIAAAIEHRGWTQSAAARHCGVTQPRINDLVNGRLSRFSLDALVNIAAALGEVTVELHEA